MLRACTVPHPLCTWTFEKGVLNMIEQNDCQEDTPKVTFSNKELQSVTTMYFQ